MGAESLNVSLAHRPSHGIALITAGSFFGAVSDAMTKLLTVKFTVAQLVVGQSIVVLVALATLAVPLGARRVFGITRWRAQLARGVFHVGSSYLFISSLAVLPFSTAVMLWFANPLFTAALAPLLLGESTSAGRWTWILVGFGGVAIIARPGESATTYLVLYPLGAALCGAIRDMLTRTMSIGESSESMIFYSTATMLVTSAFFVGGSLAPDNATSSDALLLGASGLVYLAALFLIAEALRHAKASAVAPFKYTTIVWATAIDLLVWDNVPAWNVIAGAIVIVVATYALFRIERRAPSLSVR